MPLTDPWDNTAPVPIAPASNTFDNTGPVAVAQPAFDNTNPVAAAVVSGVFDNTAPVPSSVQALSHCATNQLTLSGAPADGSTITIGIKVYTFQTTLTDVDGNVKIGGNPAASIANLIAAINLAAGAGSTYAASTTVSPDVTAAVSPLGGSAKMDVTAKANGPAGLLVATTETISNGAWATPTLTFPPPVPHTIP